VCAWWNAGSRYVVVMKENEYLAGVDRKFWKTGGKSYNENV
jgi:hypothetical protein